MIAHWIYLVRLFTQRPSPSSPTRVCTITITARIFRVQCLSYLAWSFPSGLRENDRGDGSREDWRWASGLHVMSSIDLYGNSINKPSLNFNRGFFTCSDHKIRPRAKIDKFILRWGAGRRPAHAGKTMYIQVYIHTREAQGQKCLIVNSIHNISFTFRVLIR